MRWEEVQKAWENFLRQVEAYEETLQESLREALEEKDLPRSFALRQEQKILIKLRTQLRKVQALMESLS
ncbi:MAG: hypothetical protein N3A68_08250 [Bacteroidia bacterium]|jgi:hypothetical protein|nr:hypothetical protein [Bacteroidia bacterium]GIV22799.1 MAG: hypothetical protein KatS3mg025_0458 [Bacteroidia bacterium]